MIPPNPHSAVLELMFSGLIENVFLKLLIIKTLTINEKYKVNGYEIQLKIIGPMGWDQRNLDLCCHACIKL